MQRKYLQIVIGLHIVSGIAALTNAQLNSTTLSSNIAATPVPSNPAQKIACVMPTPLPSKTVTPVPTPNPNDERQEIVDEMTWDIVTAVAKRMDWDCDGISDYRDNCIEVPNPKQKDRNKNGIGDVCESKKVGCMIPTQSTPTVTSPLISNQNVKRGSRVASRPVSSVIAGLKLSDWDCDGISDYDDNCDVVYNPRQADGNKNGIGDACESKKRRKNRPAYKNKKRAKIS